VGRSARGSARALGAAWAVRLLLGAVPASAQPAPPAAHEDDAFDFMNLLAHHNLHDIDDESWNAYGQFTYISSWHPPFSAPYTNADGTDKSLVPDWERSYTLTTTLFFGVRLWPGAEGYFVPEFIAEVPFSGLTGIGGAIQNFELQKTGSPTGQLYRSRAYLRQTIGFGGERVAKTSDPMQLATTVDSRRLVLTAGNFTVLDFFDKNSATWDPRQTFFNMAFMTHASWDFAADERGYTDGVIAEIYWDDWALRFGRTLPPQEPNSQAVDFRFWEFYSDQLEIEHDHQILGQAGAVRILGYRNSVYAGRFADAIAAFEANPADNAAACGPNLYNFGSGNVAAPDLCWVRKRNVKVGIGINLEQHVTHDIGVFSRAMVSDGQTEVDAFNAADRDLSFGAVAKGSAWHRRFDVTGVGFGMSWISQVHAQYLRMGGVDNFIGDGRLRQAAEGVVDVFYSVNFLKAIWLTADYEYLWNPAYNADRGPVNIFGGRVHAEF
jgi:high affinity Mn2+ porin